MHEIAEFFTLLPSAIPTPAAIGLGLIGLTAGWAWMRASARHQLDAARRLSASTAVYYARAEAARNELRAIDEPTQVLDVTALRAAMMTPRERLADWMHDKVAHIREEVTYQPPRDWAEGEMTETFNRIIDNENWDEVTTAPRPGDAFLTAFRAHELSAPPLPLTAPPPVAPRGAQAPARRDPAKRLPARQRLWNRELLNLRVPPLSLPPFPEMFRMPQVRMPRSLPHDPRRMAMLPPDPMRHWRRPARAAM